MVGPASNVNTVAAAMAGPKGIALVRMLSSSSCEGGAESPRTTANANPTTHATSRLSIDPASPKNKPTMNSSFTSPPPSDERFVTMSNTSDSSSTPPATPTAPTMPSSATEPPGCTQPANRLPTENASARGAGMNQMVTSQSTQPASTNPFGMVKVPRSTSATAMRMQTSTRYAAVCTDTP